MNNKIIKYLLQIVVIYVALIISYTLAFLPFVYIFKEQPDLGFIDNFQISFFTNLIFLLPLSIFFNLLVISKYFKKFRFDYIFIFIAVFIANSLMFTFQEFHASLIPYSYRGSMLVYVFLIIEQIVEFSLIAIVLSLAFNLFKRG